MDFTLTEDQVFIKDTLRRFMLRECPREKAHEMDEEGIFPDSFLAKIAGLGFCSLNVPEDYEGGGQNMLGAAVAAEEIAAAYPTLAALYAAVVFRGAQVIAALGSPAQKAGLLPQIAAGELIFGFALDDELAGEGISITYDRQQGGRHPFLLNGVCPFVGLAEHCDYLIVQARQSEAQESNLSREPASPALSSGGGSLFVVPAGAPGVRIQGKEVVGYRGAGAAEVFFDNVDLSGEEVLGGAGQVEQGKTQAAYLQAIDRLATAAISLGLAQGAYSYTANYARERAQFGQTIIQFEAIQHMLTELATGIQSARWLLYHACWLVDQGKPFALEASMACLQARDLARQAGLRSVHILGGYGYMAEYDAQRYLRDSLAATSEGRSNEILKNQIGYMLGLGTEL